MRKIKYTVIPVIVCFVIAFSGLIPVSASSSTELTEQSFTGYLCDVNASSSQLVFSTIIGYKNLSVDDWNNVQSSNDDNLPAYITRQSLTKYDPQIYQDTYDYNLFSSVCTQLYRYNFTQTLSNLVLRVPLNFYFRNYTSSSDKYLLNNLPFQPALDYVISFHVVVRGSKINQDVIGMFPLYLLFFDNESGIVDDYYTKNGGYWKHFYVKRFTANSVTWKTSSDGNVRTYSLDFKLVLSGSDLCYCRNMVLQFPVNQSSTHLGASDCEVRVYNPVYDALSNSNVDENITANIDDTKNNINDVTDKQNAIDNDYNAEATAYNTSIAVNDGKSLLTDNSNAFENFWDLTLLIVKTALPCFVTLAICCVLLGLALNTLGRR